MEGMRVDDCWGMLCKWLRCLPLLHRPLHITPSNPARVPWSAPVNLCLPLPSHYTLHPFLLCVLLIRRAARRAHLLQKRAPTLPQPGQKGGDPVPAALLLPPPQRLVGLQLDPLPASGVRGSAGGANARHRAERVPPLPAATAPAQQVEAVEESAAHVAAVLCLFDGVKNYE